jgi:hypothetical protein
MADLIGLDFYSSDNNNDDDDNDEGEKGQGTWQHRNSMANQIARLPTRYVIFDG